MSNDSYPVKRDLDGVYYRVMRGGKPYDLCFSDLTSAERDTFLARLDEAGLVYAIPFNSIAPKETPRGYFGYFHQRGP